jgi:pimeloyl-ACP methyl ester carboxylesterase
MPWPSPRKTKMKETIETRDLIVLDTGEGIVRGTYHKAFDKAPGSESNPAELNRVGLLFLNSLTPTRAATGDSAVFWADCFAKRGYPSFRVDSPGFGDSDGDPPVELLSFVNRGGYASVSAAIISQLIARYKLPGMIIVGLCAGAVSAIYTAAAAPGCKGLILMDPYFYLPHEVRPSGRPAMRQRLNNRISRSAIGRLFKRKAERVAIFRVFFSRATLPPNANVPLVDRLRSLASAGLPVLIFNAQGQRKLRQFDYLSYILGLAGSRSKVLVKTVEGTGHSFSNPTGRATVRQDAEGWLNTWFPLQRYGKDDERVLRPQLISETAPCTLQAQ